MSQENLAAPAEPVAKLEFLIKLIPETFDGDRLKLRSFIKQVDAVFENAHASQKGLLLLYVKSKITGKAREQLDMHSELETWEEISDMLLNLYQDKKSVTQLLEELHSIKQEKNEDIAKFHHRLEDLSYRVLASVTASEVDENLVKGRISMINDMTLNRFIYHTHPQISQMLRYREFKTIADALAAATAEEKALK